MNISKYLLNNLNKILKITQWVKLVPLEIYKTNLFQMLNGIMADFYKIYN